MARPLAPQLRVVVDSPTAAAGTVTTADAEAPGASGPGRSTCPTAVPAGSYGPASRHLSSELRETKLLRSRSTKARGWAMVALPWFVRLTVTDRS